MVAHLGASDEPLVFSGSQFLKGSIDSYMSPDEPFENPDVRQMVEMETRRP